MAGIKCLCLLLLVCGETKAKNLSADTDLSEHEHHLVKCCGNIISTQFDDESALFVSVPVYCGGQYNTTNSAATSSIYCKVTDILFASIHSYYNYPVLVTGPAHNDTFKNILHYEKATGFIIILGKGDKDTVFSVLEGFCHQNICILPRRSRL